MLSKTNEFLSVSLVTQKGGGFALLLLFGVVSALFQVAPDCFEFFQPILPCQGFSMSFHFLRTTISQKVLTGKLTIIELDFIFYDKVCNLYYKVM